MGFVRNCEKVQVALENATDDMDLMAKLLDKLDSLQQRAEASDLYNVDVNINKMMPELGFAPEDVDRLVASFSGGWQMRIALGKILLQIINRANEIGEDPVELSRRFCEEFRVDMALLRCLPPSVEPRVT